jgi:hypothetical protein
VDEARRLYRKPDNTWEDKGHKVEGKPEALYDAPGLLGGGLAEYVADGAVDWFTAQKADAPYDEARQFRDKNGAIVSLRGVANRYFRGYCRYHPEDAMKTMAVDFLADSVIGRGHTEVPADRNDGWLKYIKDKIRGGKLVSTLEAQHGSEAQRAFDMPYAGRIVGKFRRWGDLDHFSQSVVEALNLGQNQGSELYSFGKNMGWTSAKALGIYKGSLCDGEQYNAAIGGVEYAKEIRLTMEREHKSFCAAVAGLDD